MSVINLHDKADQIRLTISHESFWAIFKVLKPDQRFMNMEASEDGFATLTVWLPPTVKGDGWINTKLILCCEEPGVLP